MKNQQSQYRHEQVDIIKNGIKNVRKLVVVEETYTEYYNYKDAKLYFFDSKFFEKQAILLVKAKVLVSYDLSQMETTLDSVHKKIVITSIPEQEINIIPSYKYYDFDQSMFNSFSKEELNRFQEKSIKRLAEDLDVTNSKSLAKRRLMEELEQLWSVAKLLGWTIEDGTEEKVVESLVMNPAFKD
ncbi:MAG: hypothetical protein CR968_05665 [Flavobacteriia bacterium]|nr:MAG: hypothetical protein CR968_05665 [Flavobacteriia bacterium]